MVHESATYATTNLSVRCQADRTLPRVPRRLASSEGKVAAAVRQQSKLQITMYRQPSASEALGITRHPQRVE
jgi:hypothetical protein